MAKSFDLEAYKKKIKQREVSYKPDSYIPVDECLQAVLGLPGLPRGHITQIYGKSDTGKTSLLFHLAAQCQANGELPIIYITEKKVDWDRAHSMGFDKEGYAIIEESYSTLEEVFEDMLNKLAEQARGELPKDIVFFWDSIGNTLSADEFVDDKLGNRDIKATMMKAAKVIKGYLRHVGPKINETRKLEVPHNASLIFLNQAYMQPPPPGSYGVPGKLVPYGGDGIWYAASIVIQTKRIGKLEAQVDNIKKKFGTKSRITIEKNHMNGIEQSGDFIVTPNSIIPDEPKAIKAYKDANKDSWGDVELEDGSEG
jgi:recombination protein RecA